MDLTITRVLGVIGELACFRGLKFRMAFKILFAVRGRDRIKKDMEFKVASTRTASLYLLVRGDTRTKKYSPGVFLEDSQHPI
jgi:hypothetical protein